MSLRQIKRQKTRAAILTAAKSLAATSNWQDLTTRQIAKTAEVSYQTLYNYFPSKVEIVRALIVETYLGPEDALLAIIIKNYQGDVLASINEINATRLALIQATDPQWWFALSSYCAWLDAVQAARASWRWWTKAATAITTSYFGWHRALVNFAVMSTSS